MVLRLNLFKHILISFEKMSHEYLLGRSHYSYEFYCIITSYQLTVSHEKNI